MKREKREKGPHGHLSDGARFVGRFLPEERVVNTLAAPGTTATPEGGLFVSRCGPSVLDHIDRRCVYQFSAE